MCVAIFSSADDDVCCVFAIFIIGALVNKLVHIQHEKVFPREKKDSATTEVSLYSCKIRSNEKCICKDQSQSEDRLSLTYPQITCGVFMSV